MGRLNFPIDVLLEITFRCNYGCMHCLVPDELRKGAKEKEELTTEEIERLIDELSEMMAFRLSVSGGEPTLRKDLLHVVAYAVEKGLWTTFVTNGSLIDKNFVQRAEKSGINEIHISLDGKTPSVHDTFRGAQGAYTKAVRSITLFKEHSTIPVIVTAVASKYNYEEIKPLYHCAREELKADGFRVDFFTPVGHGESNIDQLMLTPAQYANLYTWLYELEKKEYDAGSNFKVYRMKFFDFIVEGENQAMDILDTLMMRGTPVCEAGVMRCCISPTGEVYPCSYYNENAFRVGTVKEKSLKEIWGSPVLEQFGSHHSFTGECVDCFYRELCYGGCRGRAYHAAGMYEPDPYCPRFWPKTGVDK
ncbi:MAG: radical SAM protein [Theionarchaea archaeon]|nr:radical SAM protein [Theionarchaea archaeon]